MTQYITFGGYQANKVWDAALPDEPQRQELSIDEPGFAVRGDWASDDVELRAYYNAGGLMLAIKDHRGHRSIWLEPSTFKAFQDYINTAK